MQRLQFPIRLICYGLVDPKIADMNLETTLSDR